MMSKKLPIEITSYDVLKTLAVVLMIVDHVGFFFFPEEMMFRAVGRACVPIWAGLIGYAHSRDLSKGMIVGTVVLFFSTMIVGEKLLPLCILATFLVTRFGLDHVVRLVFEKGRAVFVTVFVAFLLVWWPLQLVLEYGPSIFCFALMGYALRNKDMLKRPEDLRSVFLIAVLFYIGSQQVYMNFDQPEFIVMAVLSFMSAGMMLFFKPMAFPALTQSLSSFGGVVRFFGRRTLEIYVVHLVAFRLLALIFQTRAYTFLDWSFF